MPRGCWNDFCSKYAFNDGETVRSVDVRARDRIVAILNKELKGRGITVVAYDRPGLHNYCLLVVLPNPGGKKSSSQLLHHFLKEYRQSLEVPLPDNIAERTNEIVAQAYREVSRRSAKRPKTKRKR